MTKRKYFYYEGLPLHMTQARISDEKRKTIESVKANRAVGTLISLIKTYLPEVCPGAFDLYRTLNTTYFDRRIQISDLINRKDIVPLFTPNINEKQFKTCISVNRGHRLALEEFYLNSGISPHSLIRSPLITTQAAELLGSRYAL